MPIYRGRRPKTWRVTAYARGRQTEKIVEGRWSDARRVELAMMVELRAATPVARARAIPAFSTFCVESYSPHAQKVLGSNTWKRSRCYQVDALVQHFGRMRLDRIDPASFADARRQAGIRPSTINSDLIALQAILSHASSLGLLEELPALRRLPTGRGRVRAWSTDEVRRLYAAAAKLTPWLVPLVHFLLETGCRKGEAIAAETSWVDRRARMLRIPVTEFWRPKDREAREVPLSAGLLQTLRPLLQDAPGPLFRSRLGRAYGFFPDKAFRAAVAAARLTGGPHTTRHTYASHFLAAVPDLRLLADVLGHSHTRVTQMYAHMLPEHLARARDAVHLAPPGKAWRPKVLTG